jgi:prophage antirepressor-like protein
VAKDVASVLGMTWDGHRIAHVPKQWKRLVSITTRKKTRGDSYIDQTVEMATLSKSGLYFFLNRSDSPQAIPFQMWVNGEVIPSIEKHGAYITDGKIIELLQKPESLEKLLTELLNEKRQRIAAEQKIEEQHPMVEAFAS